MRQTEDWANVTWETLEPPWFAIPKGMDLKYRIPWDKAFKIPYFEYRRSLKQIAMSGWPFDFVHHPHNELVVDDDDWIVPSDDDDWFNSDLENHLLNSNDEFAMWDSVVHRSAHMFHLQLYRKLDPIYKLCSNGYAFRGSVFKRASRIQKQKMVMSHTHAHIDCDKLKCSVLDLRSKPPLSLYNWHVGSFTSLIELYDPFMIRRLLPKNDPIPTPKRWRWIDPQYSQVVDLVQSL